MAASSVNAVTAGAQVQQSSPIKPQEPQSMPLRSCFGQVKETVVWVWNASVQKIVDVKDALWGLIEKVMSAITGCFTSKKTPVPPVTPPPAVKTEPTSVAKRPEPPKSPAPAPAKQPAPAPAPKLETSESEKEPSPLANAASEVSTTKTKNGKGNGNGKRGCLVM